MNYLCLILFIIAAYLLGSVNPAIIITRLVKGVDIRTLGTHNPGTSNVRRNLGLGWGILVLFLDIAKGLIPVILAKRLCFPENNSTHFSAIILISMAAITGHCKPIWHRFVGGGGIATSIGILLYLVPVEFFLSMFIGFISAQIFFRKKKYSITQITPMIFIPLAPVITFISCLIEPVKVIGSFSIGGYPWYFATGIFTVSLLIFFLNMGFVKRRISYDDTIHNEP
jgi:glycerol-3-phosphate acyltransferase PlsY